MTRRTFTKLVATAIGATQVGWQLSAQAVGVQAPAPAVKKSGWFIDWTAHFYRPIFDTEASYRSYGPRILAPRGEEIVRVIHTTPTARPGIETLFNGTTYLRRNINLTTREVWYYRH